MNIEDDNMPLFSKILTSENGINPESLVQDFKHFVHDISCQICLDIAYPTPISCKTCSKMFCKKCIDDWMKRSQKCPFDHPYEEVTLNPLTKNLLNLIKLKCSVPSCTKELFYGDYLKHIHSDCDFLPHKCNGCGLVGNKNIITMHVNLCDQFDQKCPYCSKMKKTKLMSEHLKNCEERTVNCEFCQAKVKAGLIVNHHDLCEEKEIQCKYCKIKFRRRNESSHTKELCFRELMNTVERLSDNYNDTKDANQLNVKKISKLESDKKNLEDQVVALDNKVTQLKNENDSLIKNAETLSNSNRLLGLNVEEYKKGYEEWKAYAEKLGNELQILKQQKQQPTYQSQQYNSNPFMNNSNINLSNLNPFRPSHTTSNTANNSKTKSSDTERMFNQFFGK